MVEDWEGSGWVGMVREGLAHHTQFTIHGESMESVEQRCGF
jgi:hypothetical protein